MNFRCVTFLLAGGLFLSPAFAAPKKPSAPSARRPATSTAPKSPGVAEPFAAPADDQPPQVSAQAFIVLDARTGKVLHERNADQPADRRDGFRPPAHALHTPDGERADQRKAEHAEHAMRRAAMRGQIRHRAARDGRHDVEVRRVRRDHHGRGGAGCAASYAGTHQHDPDERVCDVIQPR